MKNTIAEWERERAKWAKKIADTREAHKKEMEGLIAEHAEAVRQCNLFAASLDNTKILLAEHVIQVSGKYQNVGGEKASALESAIRDLLDGGKCMRTEYFGIKNYDRFIGQRCDFEYGMWPTHGNIVFSIGLSRPLRGNARALTEEEIDASVYYLRNIEAIQKAA